MLLSASGGPATRHCNVDLRCLVAGLYSAAIAAHLDAFVDLTLMGSRHGRHALVPIMHEEARNRLEEALGSRNGSSSCVSHVENDTNPPAISVLGAFPSTLINFWATALIRKRIVQRQCQGGHLLLASQQHDLALFAAVEGPAQSLL